MYHDVQIVTLPPKGGSLTFDLYKDFYLVPSSLPVINPPAIKSKVIDVPGANGFIDLTESLTPYPVYKNRSGSLEFVLLNNRYEHYNQYRSIHGVKSTFGKDSSNMWAAIYSRLMNSIHGRKCRITLLDDDPAWYYEGRIGVSAWKSSNDGKWPVVTLTYDLYPYKLSQNLSTFGATETGTDRWKWDPFSFVDGVIYSSDGVSLPSGFTAQGLWKDITLNTSSWTTYGMVVNNSTVMNRKLTGWMPVCPTITFNGTDMGIKIVNSELGYNYVKEVSGSSNMTFTDPECLLYDYRGNGYSLQLKGTGTVTISFRAGSL